MRVTGVTQELRKSVWSNFGAILFPKFEEALRTSGRGLGGVRANLGRYILFWHCSGPQAFFSVSVILADLACGFANSLDTSSCALLVVILDFWIVVPRWPL